MLDVAFSLDSVSTAVGMARHVPVMVVAMVVSVAVMRIGDFVNRRPSMKILALSFLLLIGVASSVRQALKVRGRGVEYDAGSDRVPARHRA